jgi:hypothetical protein
MAYHPDGKIATMHKTPKIMTRGEWVNLILGVGLLYGIVLRVAPGLLAGFPLNDGGMFLSMIRDLSDSNYLLPLTTSYNLLDIPYAYPPLGFYIARILSDALGFNEISLLRWLPVSFNILSILAFFFLAKSILQDRPRAALATAFMAVTPGGYLWHIMGGGLTRSLGGLFLLLSVFLLKQLFETGGWRNLLLTVLACSLAILSHPEIILHTAGSCALLWLFYGRTRHGTLQAGIVIVGALLVSSPWWLNILLRFGLDPFLSTLHTGMYGNIRLSSIVSLLFARLSILPVLLVFRLIGIAWSIWKRQYLFLVVWSVVPIFVEPRSSGAIIFYPLSMLAAVGFADGLPEIIDWVRSKKFKPALGDFTQNRILNLALMSVLLYLFMESFAVNFALVNTSLKPPVISALEWTREHTSSDSQFLVLTGGGVMTDPVQEWFPTLTDRHSQTTLQGLEWTLGPEFFVRHNQLLELQNCKTLACVEAWSRETHLNYSHILLNLDTLQPDLNESLHENPEYKLEYQNQSIAIYCTVE